MSANSPPEAPVELAREPDFTIGGMAVRPSIRLVAWAGREEILEPRVMQVLVALARTAGVVSRDGLIASCWEGRVVGEDAINRAIGRLRRLAEDSGGAFTIETIARVGYRLKPGAGPSSAEEVAEPRPIRWRPGWIAAGAAILTAAGIAGWWWFSRPLPWQLDDFRVVVSTPLYENDPALAPNGTMIAYAAGPAPYAWHIFIRGLSAGLPVQLTDGPDDDDMQPAWSPQSDRIAFIRHREGVPCTIIVKPVPAGDEHIAGHCQEDDYSSLTWAPDGDVLYYSDRPRNHAARRIMRLDLAGGPATELTHPRDDITGDRNPKISPNGKRMTFMRASKGASQQMLLDLTTGKERPLATAPGLGLAKEWIDDDTLVMAGGIEPSIYAFTLDGKLSRLGINTQSLGELSRGPDHGFAVETYREQIVLASPPAPGKTEPGVLQATTGISAAVEFAPDGKLAYAHAGIGGPFEIWGQDPGGAPHQLTAINAHYIAGLRWSADSRRLAFFGVLGKGRSEAVGIFTINADGTDLKPVLLRTNLGTPAFTGDGSALIVPEKDVQGWRLWRVPLSQPARAVPVTEYGWFAVRTSGAAIYAMGTREVGIWRIDGVRRHIATLPKRCTEAFMECQSWGVSGDTLMFADHRVRGAPALILHSLTDGTERTIAAPGLDNRDEAARDPNTGRILYAYDGVGDSDIALFHLVRK